MAMGGDRVLYADDTTQHKKWQGRFSLSFVDIKKLFKEPFQYLVCRNVKHQWLKTKHMWANVSAW